MCLGDREELNVIVPSKVSIAGGIQDLDRTVEEQGQSCLRPATTEVLPVIETSAAIADRSQDTYVRHQGQMQSRAPAVTLSLRMAPACWSPGAPAAKQARHRSP